MLNFLDLLVIVFMVLSALSLLAVCLMFLVRKPVIRKVCFYIVVALGIYAATIGARIGTFLFPMQTAIALAAGAASIVALVLERRYKGDDKKFLIARVVATAALVIGIFNAVM